MRLTLTQAMLDALDRAVDKPDWLIAEVDRMKASGEPYELSLGPEQSTALEELCAMNIRFDETGLVRPQHQPLEDLSNLVMDNY
jgi:hypothetical protein